MLFRSIPYSPFNNYILLVGLPGFAWDLYCQLCLYVSLFLCLSMSPYLCLYLYLTLPWICLPADLPSHPSLSLTPPSLFPDKKFPAVEAHFWLDELFYYIDRFVFTFQWFFWLLHLNQLLLFFKAVIGKVCTTEKIDQFQFVSTPLHFFRNVRHLENSRARNRKRLVGMTVVSTMVNKAARKEQSQ